MTKEVEEVILIDTDHEEGEISDDDEEVISVQGGGTSRASSRNIGHIESQPSDWVVNYDDRGRHTVPSYKLRRQHVQQKHYSHTGSKYQNWDNTPSVKHGTKPEVTKKNKAHNVRSIAHKKSLPKTKRLERRQESGHNRSRMRYSSSSSSSYKTRSSSLSSSCSGSSSSSSCSTCSSSSLRSSGSYRSQSRSRSRTRSRSRSKSRNRSQSPRYRSKRGDKKNAKAVHRRPHRSRSKCSPHHRFSDRMSPRTKLKKLAAFDSALRQAKGSKRFLAIDCPSQPKKTAVSEGKALANVVAKLGKTEDKSMNIEENEMLESEKKPKPGSLGEMLLKKKLKLLKKFTHQSKETKAGSKLLEDKDDKDELELRLAALQTAFKFLNALDKIPKEDNAVEEHLEVSKDDNLRTEVTESEEVDVMVASVISDPKENKNVTVDPAEVKGGKNIPVDENSINDLDLQNILTTDTYLSGGKTQSEMLNLISPDSDQDPVDMDISSSSDTDVEDNVQKIDEEEGSKREGTDENDDLPVKYGDRKGDGDNFQIPVEWAYMMPPPPPPDHPPNDIKNINSWCYEQNMYLQTLSSYGKENYNEDYGQMRWGSLQNNQQSQQQQLQQQGTWDKAVMHSQCDNEKISFKDQESEKDSGQLHNYSLYYMQESSQGDLDYQPLCEENYRARESAVGTGIGTLKDAPAQHYEAFMSAVLQQRDVGMIESRKGNQESHAEGLSENAAPKTKVGNRPGSVLIEIKTESVVNGKSKQEKKAEARRRRKERMKERAKHLKANLKEIPSQESSGKMKGDLNCVVKDNANNMELVEEDEDVLRAKLLIDLSRKKQLAKDTSQSSLAKERGFEIFQSNQDSLSGIGSPLSSASPASPASPAHLVRRAAHKNSLLHSGPGRVKEGSPASPSRTSLAAVSRHLHDIGGNGLDPKSRAYDLPITSKETVKSFKIPKIKPVIISLESDEESDGQESAVSNKNVRTKSPVAGASKQPSVVSNSIDLLLRTFRNASVTESAEKGSATSPVVTKKKPAITDGTPQAVRHLSRTQQAEYKWLKEQLRKKTLLKKRLQAKTKSASKGNESSGKEIVSKLELSSEGRRPTYCLEEKESMKDLNLGKDVEIWNDGKVPNISSVNAEEAEQTATSSSHSQSISIPVTQHRVVKRNSGGLEIRLHNDVATSATTAQENVDSNHEKNREKRSDDILNSEKPEPINDSDDEEETLRALLLNSLKQKQRHKETVSHNVTPEEVCLHGKQTRNCMCDVCMPNPKDLRIIVKSDGTGNENKEAVNECEGRKVVYDNSSEQGIHNYLVGCGQPEGEGTARTEDEDTKSFTKEDNFTGNPEAVAEEEPTDQDIFLQSDWMVIDEAEDDDDDSDCLNSVGSDHSFEIDGELQSASLQKPSIDVKEKLDLGEESLNKLSEELVEEESCKDSTKLGDEDMKDKLDVDECVKNSEQVNQHLTLDKQKRFVVAKGNRSVCSPAFKSDVELERNEEKDTSEKGVFKEVLESSYTCNGNTRFEKKIGIKKVAQELKEVVDGPLEERVTDMVGIENKKSTADSFSFSVEDTSMETIGKEVVEHLVTGSPEIRSCNNRLSKVLVKSTETKEPFESNIPEPSDFIAPLSQKQNGNEVVAVFTGSNIEDEMTRNYSSIKKKVESDAQKCEEGKQKCHLAEQDKAQSKIMRWLENVEGKEQAPSDEKVGELLKDEQGSRNVEKSERRKELGEIQKQEPENQVGKQVIVQKMEEGEQTLNQMTEMQGKQVLNQVLENQQQQVCNAKVQGEVCQVPKEQKEVLNWVPGEKEEQVINHKSEKVKDVKILTKHTSERQGDEVNLAKVLKKKQIQESEEDELQASREKKLARESLILAQRSLDKAQENVTVLEIKSTAEGIRSKQMQLLKRVEAVYLLKRKTMNESVIKVSDLLHSVMKDKKEQAGLSEEIRKLRHQLHNMEKLFKAKSAAVENKLSQIKQLETQLETDKNKMEQLERRGKSLGKQIYGNGYCLPKVAKVVPADELKKGVTSGAVLSTSRSPLPKSEISNSVSQKNTKMQLTRNEKTLGNGKNTETQLRKNFSLEKQKLNQFQKTKKHSGAVPYVKVLRKTHDAQNEIPSPKTGLPNVQVKPSSESSRTVRNAESEDCSLQKLDEMSELCPYDLLGRCNDDSCLYQHLRQKNSSEKETSAQQKQENGRQAVKERVKGATGNKDGILQTGRAQENCVEEEFKQTAITFSSKVSNIISHVTQLIKKSSIRSSDKENRKCRSDSELQNVKEVKAVLPETTLLQTEPCSNSSSIENKGQQGELNNLQSECLSQTVCTLNTEHSSFMAGDLSSLPTTQEQVTTKPDCPVSGTQRLVNGSLVKETELTSETKVKESESASEMPAKEVELIGETQGRDTELVSETLVQETELASETLVQETELASESLVKETKLSSETLIKETKLVKETQNDKMELVSETQDMKEAQLSLLETDVCKNNSEEVNIGKVVPKRQMRAKRRANRNTSNIGTKRRKLIKESDDVKSPSMHEDESEVAKDVKNINTIQNADTFQSGRITRGGARVKRGHAGPSRGRSRVSRTRSKTGCQEVKPAGSRRGQKETKRGRGRAKRRSC